MFSRSIYRSCCECAPLKAAPRRTISSLSSRTKQALPRQPLQRPTVQTPSQNHRIERRHASFVHNAKVLFKQYPFSVSLATAIILFGAGTLVYVNYVYQTYIIGAFHKYPEPVAKKLRRALYYTNSDVQPKEALKYYKQALQVAEEEGMDPFSDEIIGVKIHVAALMEKIQNFPKAIEVLEIVRADCLEWEAELGGLDRNSGKRTRVLAKTVAISVKLGELYSNPYIRDTAAAEEQLVWAVETILKEKQRREKEGVKEDEGEWITDDELGASLEALAHNYEEKDLHYLAAPLFLQALSIKPREDCHSVVLMNNLSISLAQQSPPSTAGVAPPSRSALVESARSWATKAIDVAARIEPPERNEECDMGCAVALHSLGEFAEMNGDFTEAMKRYKEAASLARAIGFVDAAKNSQEGLKRLAGGNAIER